MADGCIQLHGIQPERPIAVQHHNLVIRLARFSAQPKRESNAHRPERPGVEAMTWAIAGNGLTSVIQNFLPIYAEDRVAVDEIANLPAQAQRVDG